MTEEPEGQRIHRGGSRAARKEQHRLGGSLGLQEQVG